MDKLTDKQIIHCLNLYLNFKQNHPQTFNASNVDDIVSYIQQNWDK